MEELGRVQIDPKGKTKKPSKYDSLEVARDTLQGYIDQALGAFYVGCDQTGLSKSETERALRNTDKGNIESASDETTKQFLEAIKNPFSENAHFYDGEDNLKSFREMILNLKDLIDQVIECENQLKKVKDALRDFEIAITSEIFSESFIQRRIAEVDDLEETIKRKLENNEYDTVEATVAARRDLSQCDALRKTYDLSFILDDIDYDKLIDTFMRRMSNDYCFKKAAANMEKMNLSIASLNSFANLEEQYFDKKYEAFNNFFLFHVIRVISHMDTRDKLSGLRAKTLLHGLVGYVSAPDKCEYIGKLVDKFYEPILTRLKNGDPNVLRVVEANPYTTEKSTDIDKEIRDTVIDNEKERAISYIKYMILVEGSASSEETVDIWINNASDEKIIELMDKISMLVALDRFDPKSHSIIVLSAIDYDDLKSEYDKLNVAYDTTCKK